MCLSGWSAASHIVFALQTELGALLAHKNKEHTTANVPGFHLSGGQTKKCSLESLSEASQSALLCSFLMLCSLSPSFVCSYVCQMKCIISGWVICYAMCKDGEGGRKRTNDEGKILNTKAVAP